MPYGEDGMLGTMVLYREYKDEDGPYSYLVMLDLVPTGRERIQPYVVVETEIGINHRAGTQIRVTKDWVLFV